MARELRRLLIDPARLGGDLALNAEESRYLTRVLRYGNGDRFAVVDGAGRLWSAVLLDRRTARLEQPPGQPLEAVAAAAPALTLAVAMPRLDGDVVVRMACELGVDRLQPLLAERGTGGIQAGRTERWTAILREASEQCERLWLPELGEAVQAQEWLAQPWPGLALIATSRRQELPRLCELLGPWADSLSAPLASQGVKLAIGPEGGWSPNEEERAIAAGWQAVDLGPRILRTSTAAVAGLGQISAWRAARWGC
ncbi:16S rRNA (uracil(1498)-N(3))-methyltransferase [Synechococcus sp. CS-602]|uniref:16S rRNA (uracil(1498)-N(3))-methyltransferase n=1 Tax=Synechococcaceae TaxID=1890426 RepID=UPI0008FF2936|nr:MULTISPECIES: 16S rRNA (uracil(1498)-N(3))-methyltransferase [Synechococcaceae]MCT4365456.1 16S rRNA (uracil(1498)-N(3))-methyltransferase [Candidatus Regnicoccus frigidus MAG-AL1]APD47512.1 16S rRNA (uracil(1498)-N(3))-methyltransferase [Synechococcus sp. SynAce01]MCT0202522.1 16S rRNA (uracil(1498)-N(3))-methyltransferase [Synechococcus sp. CS-603]MCT0204326.1 16S rRNA (uracil(1498)-N(3))-methyltransferase [Synechococcus sp. CS-602]MCT0247168.1 16S rRNA (uracil(1498)-N(3))-methyltransfera